MFGGIPVVADDLPVVVDHRLNDAALDGLDVLAQQLADAAHVAADVHLQQGRQRLAGGEDVRRDQQLGGGAVVVHRDGKAVGVGDGGAVGPGQVLDAVARLLRDVDVVVDALKGIVEVIAGRGVEGDGQIARLPGLEEGGRPLHVVAQLRAVHLQLVEGVLVGVDAGQVALADGALPHLAGHRGHGGGRDLRTGVVQLRLVDKVEQGGVLHHGAGDVLDLVVGGHVAAAQLADGDDGVGLGPLVVGGQQGHQLGIGLIVGDLDALGAAADHLPLAVPLALQLDVDLRHGGAGVLVLDHQHAVDLLAGDLLVAVGRDDDVKLGAGVGQVGDARAVDAVLVLGVHVHDADQDVDLVLDLVDDLAALVHGVGDGPAGQVDGVPPGDVGGDHADQADLDVLLLDDGVAVGQGGAVGGVDVAGQDLGVLLADDVLQGVHAVVVLMVAGHPHIVADGVHGGHHGVDVVFEEELGRVALDGVARVHHQGVGGAQLLDGGGLLGHAAAGVRLVGRVVPGIKLAVGVAGGQDLQVHGEGPERGSRCRGRGAHYSRRCRRHAGRAHKGTPGNHSLFHEIPHFLSTGS